MLQPADRDDDELAAVVHVGIPFYPAAMGVLEVRRGNREAAREISERRWRWRETRPSGGLSRND